MLFAKAFEAPRTDAVRKPDVPSLPGRDTIPSRVTEVMRVPRAAPDEHRRMPLDAMGMPHRDLRRYTDLRRALQVGGTAGDVGTTKSFHYGFLRVRT
jgi:hypothetical protein